LFSIALLCFPNADEIVKATFRNAVLTLYAITIAIPVSPERHTSVEIRVILHGFVNVLFISAFALMCFRPVLRTWRHIAALVGTLPLEAWAAKVTTTGIFNPQCGEFDDIQKVALGSNDVPLYGVLWGVSCLVAMITLPFLSLVSFRKVLPRFRVIIVSVALFLWFATWVLTCAASEASLVKFYRKPGFGQIMAVVMLFSQVWDIACYPFQPSDHGGTRFAYWRKTQFTPWYTRVRQRFRKSMIHSIMLYLILDSKHKYSAECEETGGICLSEGVYKEDLKKEPRISVEDVGPESQLLPPMNLPDPELLEDMKLSQR
jgi:hypothetical protein